MEGSGNNNRPVGNTTPRLGYSTVGPHPNHTSGRPRLAELDLTNNSATRSPSLAPSMSSQASGACSPASYVPSSNFPTGTPSAPQPSRTQPGRSLRPLPQRVIEKYPDLAGMTREEAWQWEVNERNEWIASAKKWIIKAKEVVMSEKLATDSDVLQGLEDSMTRMIDSLPDFENRESIPAICMQEDRLRKSRRADLQIPEFQPRTASPMPTPSITGSLVAPSNTQGVASSGSAITGTGADTVRELPVAAENLMEKLVRVVGENFSGVQAADLFRAMGGMQTTGGPGISSNAAHEESGPTARGSAAPTHTPTRNTVSEAPQQPRDSSHGSDGDKTPRAQAPSRAGSIHGNDVSRSQTSGSEDHSDRSQWLPDGNESNQRSQAPRSSSTTASRNVEEPPRHDTPTRDATTTPDNHDSSDNNTDTDYNKRYVGYYQEEPPYKLAPKRGTSASSSCKTPTQPPKQPQGSGTTDNTKTADQPRASPGDLGGGRQGQGSLQGQGSVRGRGSVNYYNQDRLGEIVRVAHPDRPNESIHSSRTGQQNPGQQQQRVGSSRWPPTNTMKNENSKPSPSGSQVLTARQEPRGQGQGQGHPQDENQAQGRAQKQSEWDEQKPKDGTTRRNDW